MLFDRWSDRIVCVSYALLKIEAITAFDLKNWFMRVSP
jgi:hypothetical protein